VSRKTHSTEGSFDVPMPLAGGGVEPRNTAGNHTLVFTFNNSINSGSATAVGATVASTAVNGTSMIVNLSGVPDGTQPTVTATGVTDTFGQTMADTSVAAGFLVGDVNGDRVVNGGDALITRNRAGQSATEATFRSDVNTDGTVSVGDTVIIRNRSGNSIAGADAVN
jgi:hypothetical protein